jgi:hypothetical protein
MTSIMHEELIGLLYWSLNARMWKTGSIKPMVKLSDTAIGFAYYPTER